MSRLFLYVCAVLSCAIGLILESSMTNFVFAQAASKTTSYQSYLESRSKPVKLSDWLKNTSKLTDYRNPKTALEQGNLFIEQYLVVQRRELDVLHEVIKDYVDKMITSQQTLTPGGSTAECASLTSLDIVALMSNHADFQNIINLYPVVQMESFSQESLDGACRRWVACVGSTAAAEYRSLTAAQPKHQVCQDRVTNQLLSLYNVELPLRNFDIVNQYNNIFMDGTGSNSPFDIGEDMYEIKLHHFENLIQMTDSTVTGGLMNTIAYGQIAQELPQELIASTQQLLQALDLDTSIDPRQDDEIIRLMGQFTVISGSSVAIPTGNVLNLCLDPDLIANQTQSLLEQLRNTQQQVSDYNQSLNTNQTLNDAINGVLEPNALAPTTVRLSVVSPPDTTIAAEMVPPSLTDNTLGQMLSNIDSDDVRPVGSGGSSVSGGLTASTSIEGAIGGTGEINNTLKACTQSCDKQYSKSSSCVETCEAEDVEGFFNKRYCETTCTNARIACLGQCLCSSSTEVAQKAAQEGEEVSKIHEAFEVRRCLIPSNKPRTQFKSCVRKDPITGMPIFGSLECHLEQTIQQGNYNRESGKGGVRVKPREGYQLSIKFDLSKMIRFPISVISKVIRSSQDKKREIQESKNKQEYENTVNQDPILVNTKIASDPQTIINQFIDNQTQLRELIQTQAKAIEKIVQK